MTTVWISLGLFLLVAGLIGCVVPALPGPILSFAGLLCLMPTGRPLSTAELCVFGGMTAVVMILDYVVPAWGARKFNCSRWGTFGCFVGTIAGLFFLPIGILLGPFFGAVVGELIADRGLTAALRGGVGALLGFLSGVFLKLIACGVMAAFFCNRVFR